MITNIKDEKQGVAPYEFAKALAFSVVPTEMLNLELLRHHFTDDAIQAALNSHLRTMTKPVEGQPVDGARIWEHTESVVR